MKLGNVLGNTGAERVVRALLGRKVLAHFKVVLDLQYSGEE